MIPTVYVKFLTPDPDVGPPPEPSGLRRFYTVAFDAGVMKQALWFEHGHLEAGIRKARGL